jgi:hypothetical protein
VNSRELNLIAEQSNIKLLADKQKTITTFVHVVNNKRTLESIAVFGINTRERN